MAFGIKVKVSKIEEFKLILVTITVTGGKDD